MITIAVVTLFIITTSCKATSEFCSPEFSNKCFCGLEEYLNKQYYIVNCTDTGFTRADMLQHLPPQTEVLLFTGNNVTELPLNIFGTQNNSKLRIIDMSNNHIKIIRGKSFHHVSNVERLILNHNEISISSDDPALHHPRIFSNFENLIELHLTDAFADNSPEGLAADLHDIFVSSDLSLLRKLHLEQNEISQFQDSRVFCDLPSLQDLHLGQNALQGIHVELSCLKHLRFLDLQANFMYSLNGEELSQLDIFPTRNQSLTIDLSNNPLTCNCDELYSWLRDTKVEVRNKNKLHCRRSLQDISPHCTPKLLLKPLVLEPVNNNLFLISVLFIILCVSVFLNIYTNREYLRHTFTPALQAVTKKVHYTTIGKPEDPEMDV